MRIFFLQTVQVLLFRRHALAETDVFTLAALTNVMSYMGHALHEVSYAQPSVRVRGRERARARARERERWRELERPPKQQNLEGLKKENSYFMA